MNLKQGFLRAFKWCPGVDVAANFLPNKEYSKRTVMLRLTSSIFGFILLGLMFAGVPVPAKYPFVKLMIKTNQETYFEDESLNVEFVFINQMPFTIRMEPFSYYEESLYKIENNQSILYCSKVDDVPPRPDEVGMVLRPFSSSNQNCLVSFPDLRKGDYVLIMEVEGYRISKNIRFIGQADFISDIEKG